MMRIPMYGPDGSPRGHEDIPDDVMAAVHTLTRWADEHHPDGLWMLGGLGMVDRHVARALVAHNQRLMRQLTEVLK